MSKMNRGDGVPYNDDCFNLNMSENLNCHSRSKHLNEKVVKSMLSHCVIVVFVYIYVSE